MNKNQLFNKKIEGKYNLLKEFIQDIDNDLNYHGVDSDFFIDRIKVINSLCTQIIKTDSRRIKNNIEE